MITYDHLWLIQSTYDGWRRLKMLFWGIRVAKPTKNCENKTVCVFFHCAFDGNAPGRRNITQKSKNNETLDFQKARTFEIVKPCSPGAVFHAEYGSGLKSRFWQNSKKVIILFKIDFIMVYITSWYQDDDKMEHPSVPDDSA